MNLRIDPAVYAVCEMALNRLGTDILCPAVKDSGVVANIYQIPAVNTTLNPLTGEFTITATLTVIGTILAPGLTAIQKSD